MTESAEELIRVLIVDDIAETRENLRKLLQFESDVVVVGSARTGVEAIDIARETEPDVVIMDINMPDMDGIEATEAMLRDVPFTQIVMLSVNNDADYVRRARLHGPATAAGEGDSHLLPERRRGLHHACHQSRRRPGYG